MALQHRDVPNTELHELKGASTAIIGSVPVANGSGGTNFQKLGPANFSGSIPTAVDGIVIATDGSGGFRSVQSSYGRFQYTPGLFPGDTGTMSALITPLGLYIDGQNIGVSTAGFYLVAQGDMYLETPEASPVELVWPFLINAATSAVLLDAVTGIVYLDPSLRYRLNRAGEFSVWRIQV